MPSNPASCPELRRDVATHPEGLFRGVWRRIDRFLLWLMVCGEVARQRWQLASLDDRALKDLGLSRSDVHGEAERPFWDHSR